MYERDVSAGMGLQLVPKLKYEHINITSFSAMWVDLAATVYMSVFSLCVTLYLYINVHT